MKSSLRDRFRESKVYYMLGNPIYRLKGKLFDLKYGVTTAPEVKMSELEISSRNARLGVKHAATEPRYFNRVLDEWAIEYSRFSFTDFGSGMGRVILMASERPFKRIIGVEFSQQLIDVCKQNLSSFRSSQRKCQHIDIVCTDAAEYDFPNEPSIYYFFIPFGRSVFAEVIANLERSLTTNPREAYVLYANPEHNDLFEQSPIFEQIASGPWHTIHKARPITEM